MSWLNDTFIHLNTIIVDQEIEYGESCPIKS